MSTSVSIAAENSTSMNPAMVANNRATHAKRLRILSLLLVLITGAAMYLISRNTDASLGNERFATGYALATICALLALLPLRKKMVRSNFGSIALWQATHQYLGCVCLLVYAMHAGFLVNGWIEMWLAITFWFIIATGFLSWYVNRTSPKMIRAAGVHVLREDLPQKKREFAEKAYRIALSAAGRNESAVLADFYRIQLTGFFNRPRNLRFRVFPTASKCRLLTAGLAGLDRYLGHDAKAMRDELIQLVDAKDRVDFQHAIQVRVRVVAALHSILLSSFVLLCIAHVYLAFRFSSHW